MNEGVIIKHRNTYFTAAPLRSRGKKRRERGGKIPHVNAVLR